MKFKKGDFVFGSPKGEIGRIIAMVPFGETCIKPLVEYENEDLEFFDCFDLAQKQRGFYEQDRNCPEFWVHSVDRVALGL